MWNTVQLEQLLSDRSETRFQYNGHSSQGKSLLTPGWMICNDHEYCDILHKMIMILPIITCGVNLVVCSSCCWRGREVKRAWWTFATRTRPLRRTVMVWYRHRLQPLYHHHDHGLPAYSQDHGGVTWQHKAGRGRDGGGRCGASPHPATLNKIWKCYLFVKELSKTKIAFSLHVSLFPYKKKKRKLIFCHFSRCRIY